MFRVCKNYVRNILKNRNEITDQKHVSNKVFDFYNNLYESDKGRPNHDIAQFLNSIQIPHFTEEQSGKFESSISADEFLCGNQINREKTQI